MAINHRYLAGKEIDYTDENGNSAKAIVVNIDRNIGITIVLKDNKNLKLTCLNGPSTQYYKKRKIKRKNYDTVFNNMVNRIVSGKFYVKKCFDESIYFGEQKFKNEFSSMASCPYSGE